MRAFKKNEVKTINWDRDLYFSKLEDVVLLDETTGAITRVDPLDMQPYRYFNNYDDMQA